MKKIVETFNVKYVGEKPNFEVKKGAYINKNTCGCGLTTFLLTNKENVIVAVPTKNLIFNKVSQINGLLAVDGDTTLDGIKDYLRYKREGHIKIVVTFDSIYKVEWLIGRCRLVIDEVQSFFKNYNNKTDLKFNRNLYRTTMAICEQHKDDVTFVSATPVPVEYMPEWVQDLTQVSYEFQYTYRKTPIIAKVNNPIKSLVNKIIEPIISDGSVTIKGKRFSKCLIFINSISEIINIIKDNGWDSSLFGIYCGDTAINDAKLSEAGISRFTGLYDLPQFAFVTKSGFEGCDFYDAEAMTIVVSQSNKDYKMVDVNTDLLQAISRLRNDNNPNRDRYIFIYNQSIYTKSDEELMAEIEQTQARLLDGCTALNDDDVPQGAKELLLTCPDVIAYTDIRDNQYILDTVAFNSVVYKIKEVRSKFLKGFDLTLGPNEMYEDLEVAAHTTISFSSIIEKVANGEELTVDEMASKWSTVATDYYNTFHSTTTNTKFAIERLEAHCSTEAKLNELKVILKNRLELNKKYRSNFIKSLLQDIYNELGIARTAKSTDILEFADGVNKNMKFPLPLGTETCKGIELYSWK